MRKNFPGLLVTVVLALALLVQFCPAQNVWAENQEDAYQEDEETLEPPPEQHSFWHKVVMYLPNRVFDVLDIFRARVRVGPGAAVGVRATKYVSAYVGSYASVYAGLPGPRQRVTPRSPVGLESYNGISVSVADATFDGGVGPNYSPTEVGASVQLLLVGVDVDFDPVELVDFLGGFFFLKIRKDDL